MTPVLALTRLKLVSHKQIKLVLPLFTQFGSIVRGKGNPTIASIGHSVLGNPKVRYYIDFSIVFLHKYMSILLPLVITPFWVAVRGKAKLKILALVSQNSEKPKVRYASDFNIGSLT